MDSIPAGPPDGAEVQHCPRCGDATVKAATLTDRFVYLRCSACGEVWVIPERRQVRRSVVRPG